MTENEAVQMKRAEGDFVDAFLELDISERIPKLWVKFFTFERKLAAGNVDQDKIESRFKGIEIAPVDPRVFRNEASDLIPKSRELLSNVLDLQIVLPDAYFEIGNVIRADDSFVPANRVLVGFFMPEVIRGFIRVTYQIKVALKANNEADIAKLVAGAASMLWCLLSYDEFIDESCALVVDLIESLGSQSFPECVCSMIGDLVVLLQRKWRGNRCVLSVVREMTSYLSKMMNIDTIDELGWETLCKYGQWIGSAESPLGDSVDDELYSTVVSFVTSGLEKCSGTSDCNQKEFVFVLFSVVAMLLPLRECVTDFREQIVQRLVSEIGPEPPHDTDNLERMEIIAAEFDFRTTTQPVFDDKYFEDEDVMTLAEDGESAIEEEFGRITESIRKIVAKDDAILERFCSEFLAREKLRRDVFATALSGLPASVLKFPEGTWSHLLDAHYVRTGDVGVIFQLAICVLTGPNKHERDCVASALTALIQTGGPELVVRVVRQLRSIDWKDLSSPGDVISSCDTVIDILIDADQTFRKHLAQETLQILYQARSEIVLFFQGLMDCPAGAAAMFSHHERRVLFIFSLIVDGNKYATKLASAWIAQAFATLKSPTLLGKGMYQCLEEITAHFTERVYLDLTFTMMCHLACLEGNNSKEVASVMCRYPILEKVAMIPQSISEFYKQRLQSAATEDEQRKIAGDGSYRQQEAIDMLIDIIKNISIASSETRKYVNESKDLIENLIALKPLVEVSSRLVEKILAVITYKEPKVKGSLAEEEIVNYALIPVLFEWAVGSDELEGVLTILMKLTECSWGNRYRCYQTNLVAKLTEAAITESEQIAKQAIMIITQICASFCCKSDLLKLVNLIVSGSPNHKLPFLKMLNAIVEGYDRNTQTSFFHLMVAKKDVLTIENIPFVDFMSISTPIRIEKHLCSISTLIFIENRSQSQEIYIQLDGELIRLLAESGDITWSATRKIGFKYYVWQTMRIVLDQRACKLFVDDVLIHVFEFGCKFLFEPGKIQVKWTGVKCDMGDIRVETANEKAEAIFTPQLMHDSICINTVDSSVTGTFEGMPVPFSSSVVESILTSGGSSLYLYMLSSVLNEPNPSQYVLPILSGIKDLISFQEEGFLHDHFFQELNFIIKSSPAKSFDKECTKALCEIFQVLKSSKDVRDMAQFVWNDICLTAMFESMIPQAYLSGAVPIASVVDCSKCLVSMSFLESTEIVSGLTELLMAICKSSLKETEAELILKFIGTSTNKVFLSVLSNVSYQLVQQKNTCFMRSIEKAGFLLPFYPLMKIDDVDMHIWAIRLFVLVSQTFGDNKAVMMLQEILANAVNELGKLSNPALLLERLFLLITEQEFTNLPFFQFLPFYGGLVKYLNKTNIENVTNRIFDAIKPESYDTLINQLSNWSVYVAFFMNLDSNLERWTSLLASIAASHPTTLVTIIMTLRLAAIHCGWDLEDILASLIREVLEQRTTTFDNQLLVFVLKCVFFSIYVPGDHQRTQETSIVRFLQHMSACSEQVAVRKRVCDKEAWMTSLLVQQTFRLVADTGFQVLGEDVGNGAIVGDFLVGIMGMLAGVPGQPYMGLVDTVVTSLKELEKPNVLVMRAVYLYLLSYFKDDEEVRDMLIVNIKQNEQEMAPYASDDVVRMSLNTADLANNQLCAAMKEFASHCSELCYAMESAIGHDYSIMIGGQKLIMCVTTGETVMMMKAFRRYQKQNQTLWRQDMESVSSQLPGSELTVIKKLEMTTDAIGRHLKVQRVRKHDVKDMCDNLLLGREISGNDVCSCNSTSVMFAAECRLLTLRHEYSGAIYISPDCLFFEASRMTDIFTQEKTESRTIKTIRPFAITHLLWRRQHGLDNAAEVFTHDGRSHYFIFGSEGVRTQFINAVKKLKLPNMCVIQSQKSPDEFASAGFTEKWRTGRINNFEYLFWCNMFSGRSFKDITRYPIYPRVMATYTSDQVALNDPSAFTDLGASLGSPCFTAEFVIRSLVRCEPFTSLYKALSQTSHLESISAENDTEYVPEFYCCPEIFVSDKPDFDNVELPKWCASANDFVMFNRLALESPIVSSRLNMWIDKLFGCQQKDPANCSPDSPNWQRYTNPEQLFSTPHPTKEVKYPPQMFGAKTKLSMEEVYLDNIQIMRMRIVGQQLVGIDSTGNCTRLTFNEGSGCEIKSWKVRCCLESRTPTQTLENFIHILPDGDTIVFTAPWMDTFDLCSLEQQQLMVKSRQHSSRVSAITVDKNLVVTGTQDSVICVWHTKNLHNPRHVTGLTSSVSKLAVSHAMDWLVAVDIDRHLLISSPSTGVTYGRAILSDSPREIHITDLGYLVLIYSKGDATHEQTIIEVRDLYGNLLVSRELPLNHCCSCICQTLDCTEFIACSFMNFEIVLFRVPDLITVASMQLYCAASELIFSRDRMMIVARRRTTNLYAIHLNPL